MKASDNIQDLLTTTRTWRRWLQRAEELPLTLPDLIILTHHGLPVKVGGSQAAYRVSSVRQELAVDLRSIKDGDGRPGADGGGSKSIS